MKKTDIEKGTREVIALNSRYTSVEIKLTDPLDKFISSSFADRLARQLKGKFGSVDTTELTNALYTSIKKVNELVDKIYSYYQNS